jgi:hypothetical protein
VVSGYVEVEMTDVDEALRDGQDLAAEPADGGPPGADLSQAR